MKHQFVHAHHPSAHVSVTSLGMVLIVSMMVSFSLAKMMYPRYRTIKEQKMLQAQRQLEGQSLNELLQRLSN